MKEQFVVRIRFVEANMAMRIDQSGHHGQTGRVDPATADRGRIVLDCGDPLTRDHDVGLARGIAEAVDNLAAGDGERLMLRVRHG